MPLFNSGIVLMLNMWGKTGASKSSASRSGRDLLAEMREMADVHAVMDMLKSIETRSVNMFVTGYQVAEYI